MEMSDGTMKVSIFRFDPTVDEKPRHQAYEVPFEEGMSAMDALDYIYQNLDSTIAYYDHAGCSLGICGRCTGKINGKPGLFCQTPISGDVTLDPLSESRVLKDLVIKKPEPGKTEEASDAQEEVQAGVQDINAVPILIRREIEALIAAPLINAFMEELGKEKALKIASKVIKGLARESGKLLSAVTGGNTMAHYQKAIPLFSQGGALEFELLESDEKKVAFNVTRCRYAEMYKEHGLAELGYLLSCGRDYALVEGYNPKIKLTRTKTIMEGDDHCDFHFSMEED
jgi:hypothetical protein